MSYRTFNIAVEGEGEDWTASAETFRDIDHAYEGEATGTSRNAAASKALARCANQIPDFEHRCEPEPEEDDRG